ncbi:MAG TPA: flagellar protein FlgN [bacterium]|nr:flagellar protein FlgN [Candidatus Omnitrophota bacterium]HOJ60222.1 flagellar protein FlgN [bacterium]HOL94019.1 flagellar protein FlgN [bacterium]HPO99991.1 flagellar protein FlgN [bacterium]HXK93258.1 flagellar protein FlgN [bacterium]
MNLKSLLIILREEQKVHEKLLLGKRKEQQLIVTGHPAALMENTKQISAWAGQARELEEQRFQIVEELAREWGITEKPVTLKRLAGVLPPENREELEKTGERLKILAREIQTANQANARLLRRSLETLHQEIARFVKPEESGIYTSRGTKAQGQIPRAGLNLRA